MNVGLKSKFGRFDGVMKKDVVQEFHFFFFYKCLFLQGGGRILVTMCSDYCEGKNTAFL